MMALPLNIEQLTIASALVLGVRHALEPGHGKAIIATYMGQPTARFMDVLIFGGVVTLAHSIVLFVSVLLFFNIVKQSGALPESWLNGLHLVAALGVVVLGVFMFMKAWPPKDIDTLQEAECATGCQHKGLASSGPLKSMTPLQRFKELTMLGVFSAMRPCPATFSSIILAIGLGLSNAVGFVISFSLGMAIVLMGIGIIAKIMGARLNALRGKFPRINRWINRLPFISACLILGLGLVFTFIALRHFV
jgi:ABC-type nickel/cobalt efflux system permease component RcnA